VAHTRGDLVVEIPQRDVLIAADLVFNRVVAPMRDGDVWGLRQTLTELRAGDSGSIVLPGHGPVGGRSLLDDQLAFIDLVVETTREVLAGGGPASAAERVLVEKCAGMAFAEQRLGDWVAQVAARR